MSNPAPAGAFTMSRSQIKSQIKQLKGRLRAANRKTNARLLRLTLVMLVLLAAAAVIYDKIPL